MPKKLTTEEFIKRAKEIHGDKYDYSKVEYINNNTKVCIVCPEHGEFFKTPDKHIRSKQGCPKCGIKRRVDSRRLTLDDFITRAKTIHHDKYDYTKVNYINNLTKVCIICPVHGKFWQTPVSHLGGHGCPVCGRNKLTNTKDLTEEFIRRARSVHGDKYDYSKVVYKNANSKVCIICSEHGEFWQKPVAHVNNKQGCPKCGGKPNRGLTKEEFVNLSIEKFGNKFDYSKVDYVNFMKDITIVCPEHGEFTIKPRYHIYSKYGCPKCGVKAAHEQQKKEKEFFKIDESLVKEYKTIDSIFPIEDEINTGVIYKYVFPNGKVYIGQTVHPRKRHLQHFLFNGERCTLLRNAFKKYGMPKYVQLEKIKNDNKKLLREKLNELEQKYIEQYKSNNRKYGYNLTSGGDTCVISEEGRKHMSEARTDKRKVLQYDLKGSFIAEYESTCAAGKALGLPPSSIWACCKGKRSHGKKCQIVHGCTFRFKDELPDVPKHITLTITEGSKTPILQYDLHGNFIRQFESIIEAERNTGICESNIRRCLNNKGRQAGGFMWRKRNEKIPLKINPCRDRIERSDKSKQIQKERYAKPVCQYTTEGIFVKEFISSSDAALEMCGDKSKKDGIRKCCHGRQKTAYGYIWKYKEVE